MLSQIKLRRAFRIQIGLHYNWFIIAFLIFFSLSAQFHAGNPQWGDGRSSASHCAGSREKRRAERSAGETVAAVSMGLCLFACVTEPHSRRSVAAAGKATSPVNVQTAPFEAVQRQIPSRAYGIGIAH
jgi:hypothetical protein